ncbi:DUF1638 domain-containing protein [Roseibium sp. HPY-6]|uniref:DUF1638 domain-containing protein n=1 Tax=Roseibium sp. HPY-6 TaxID=3229852 RepID=UPI00338E8073
MRKVRSNSTFGDRDLLQDPGEALKFRKGVGSTLLLACGALGKEIVWLIEKNGLKHLDVQCLPAGLHHTPDKIPEAVRTQIRANKDRYDKIFVLYGDCGTAGALDRVLLEEGGCERIAGPHCFSFYWGNEAFSAYGEDEITTFYLTDFFCRSFEKFIWQAFGLDRNKNMVDFVFGNYEKLVYMPQTDDPSLEKKAREIASSLGLTYERRFVGFGELETAIRSA